MLPQQVGFVCAVLALVCCASGLFGSLGRYGEGCCPPEELRGWSWDSSSFFSVRLVPRVFPPRPAGSAYPGVLSTRWTVARVLLNCSSSLGVPDAIVGVLLGPKPAPPLSLECAGSGQLMAAQGWILPL